MANQDQRNSVAELVCRDCRGSGKVNKETCPTCGGTGLNNDRSGRLIQK